MGAHHILGAVQCGTFWVSYYGQIHAAHTRQAMHRFNMRLCNNCVYLLFASTYCLLACTHVTLLRSCTFVYVSSGLCFHSTWIWSLDHTSLSHSLFYVCASPLLMSLIFFARGTRINAKEWAGLVFGLIGSTLMLLDVRSEGGETADTNIHEPTFLGDFLAFLGAVTMVTYLLAGQSIRKQIPLFLYTFPMNLLSTIPLLICSYATENITLDPLDTGANAVFGFMNKQYVGLVLLIALGPGLIGHTGINYMIEHISPLIVSVALTLEPVLGIVVGMMFHEETTPALWTLLGGPLTVIGCILTIYGTHQRESYSTVQQSIQLTATNGIHHPLPSLHDFDEEEIHDLNDDPTITIERFQSSRSTADRRNGYGDSSTQAYDVHIKPSYEMNGGSHTAAMSISPPAAATHFDPHAEDVPEFDISERELLEMLSVQQTDEEIPTANGTHE